MRFVAEWAIERCPTHLSEISHRGFIGLRDTATCLSMKMMSITLSDPHIRTHIGWKNFGSVSEDIWRRAQVFTLLTYWFLNQYLIMCVCEVPWRCETGGLTNAQRNFWSIPQSKMKTFGGGRREKLKNHYACNMIIRVYVDVMFALWKVGHLVSTVL